MTSCDALVIGAGPAGAVAATLLARAGLAVRLVDRKAFPRRKVCGACLSGSAMSALHAIGLAGVLRDAPPLESFRIAAHGRTATVPLRAGCVLSRSALDAALVREAVAAGATFDEQTTADLGRVENQARLATLRTPRGDLAEVRARVVLVAAGLAGLALRQELRPVIESAARIGAGAESEHASESVSPGTIHMATHRAGYVGFVRTETGALNLAAAVNPQFVTAQGGIGSACGRIVRDAGFELLGLEALHWTGTPLLTRRPASVAAERVFLIGDAAGYVEPFTGEGIGWAVTSAVAVAPLAEQSVRGWRPELAEAWRIEHQNRIGSRQRLCRLMAAGLRSPSAVRAAVAVLRPFPSAAAPVLRQLGAL